MNGMVRSIMLSVQLGESFSVVGDTNSYWSITPGNLCRRDGSLFRMSAYTFDYRWHLKDDCSTEFYLENACSGGMLESASRAIDRAVELAGGSRKKRMIQLPVGSHNVLEDRVLFFLKLMIECATLIDFIASGAQERSEA